MSATTVDLEGDVKGIIRNSLPEDAVSALLMERVPFVFSDDWDVFRDFRRLISTRLDVDPCDIYVTGSAAVGISLNPYKEFRAFDSSSDVDLAIVSPHHFDIGWRLIRSIRRRDVDQQTWNIIADHKTKYIYYGCIACNRILPLFPFASAWIPGLQEASRHVSIGDRAVSTRIYRDAASLRGYQVSNIRSLKAKIL